MSMLEKLLSDYNYSFPESLIAKEPARPRDAARLLVYDRMTHEVQFDTFRSLAAYLPDNALLIFNNTKVIPARLPCTLPTGGKVELLWIRDTDAHSFEALSPRTLKIGDTLVFGKTILTVANKIESVYTFTHTGSPSVFRKALIALGTTPIPPYLKHTPLKEKELRTRYQAIFAKHAGSAAAPTASLHFTPRLLTSLKKSGVQFAYVTLHVGLGTFAPLTESHLALNHLHQEYFEIPPSTIKAIQKAKKAGRPVIAVGTTALRALESAFLSTHPDNSRTSNQKKPRSQRARILSDSSAEESRTFLNTGAVTGHTTLFIRPSYTLRVVDGLITNFHVPQSSLLMLVAALIGRERLFALYSLAIQRGFRFFSFGDGMLIR